jgi:lipopolysaccharide/colanic/teichoic acid biosynthesis glycosyltransferase
MRGLTDADDGGGGGVLTELPPTIALVDHRAPGFSNTPRASTAYELVVKPLMDILGALILLIVAAPVLAAVYLLVLLQLGRPVILRQTRVGRHGRVFEVYKFRTMLPDRRQGDVPVHVDRRVTHKHPNDPRLHPLGRFLRKWSLDELPQLLNVLRGDMSLVGPRPELVSVVQRHYEPWQHARHQVRPGLTGLWQITDRGSADEMYKHTATDLQYVQRVTLWGDLRILLLTLPSALGGNRGT